MTSSNEHTDVAVVSLDDRRRIKDLEAKTADLERRLAEATGRLKPELTIVRGTCLHMVGYSVSDQDLEVTCDQCGAEMDPYEVLRKIAHREVNFCYTLNSLREEEKRLRSEVDRLKAARSRIRRRVRESEDQPPAGIAAIMREHKIFTLHVTTMPGGGAAMAAATRSIHDEINNRGIRADGVDIEAALTELVRLLRLSEATPSQAVTEPL